MKKFLLFTVALLCALTTSAQAQPYGVSPLAAGDSVEDVLNQTLIGISGTSYTDFEVTATSGTTYAGQLAAQYGSLQMRTSNSNSGIVSTKSIGYARKVVITWNSNTTSARQLRVYGSNSAYTAATDLFDSSAQGTLLATLSIADNDTELTISDDYAYIGFRSADGALYLDDITVTWEEAEIETPDDSGSTGGSDGTTVTFDASVDTNGSSAAETPAVLTKDGITITISNGMLGTGGNGNYRCYKGETMTIESTVGNIVGIDMTCTASGTSQYGPGNFVITDGGGTYTYSGTSGSWTGDSEKVVLTAGDNQVRMTKIVVTIAESATVARPTVLPASGTYYGEQEVTMTAADGCTIYYTINDSSEQTYTAPFTLSDEGTYTIAAYAQDADGNISSTTTVELVIKAQITTCAQLRQECDAAGATSSSSAPSVTLVMDDMLVTGVYNSYVFIGDDTGGFLLYGSGSGLSKGDKVSGTVTGGVYFYNGLREMSVSSWSNVSVSSSSNEVTPTTVTISALNDDYDSYESQYVKVERVYPTATSTANRYLYVVDADGNQLTIYDTAQILTNETYDTTTAYDVSCYLVKYQSSVQVYVLDVNDIVESADEEEPLPTPALVDGYLWESVEDGTDYAGVYEYWAYGDSWSLIYEGTSTSQSGEYWSHDAQSKAWYVSVPAVGSQQWQAQMHILTSLPASSAKTYNFGCNIYSTAATNVTIKLTDSDDDANFFFDPTVAVDAATTYTYAVDGAVLSSHDASTIKLVFDFAGTPEGTQIMISGIYFEEVQEPVAAGSIIFNEGVAYVVNEDLTTVYIAEQETNGATVHGDVVIPESFTYNDVKYTVTGVVEEAFAYYSGWTDDDPTSGIASLTLPGTIEYWGDYAFNGCNGLAEVTLAEGITTIGTGAFMSVTSLETVNLPSTLTSLGEECFVMGDYNFISTIVCLATTPPDFNGALTTYSRMWGTVTSTFADDCILYVPCGSLEAYLADDEWVAAVNDIVETDCPDLPTYDFEELVLDEWTYGGEAATKYYTYTPSGAGTLTISGYYLRPLAIYADEYLSDELYSNQDWSTPSTYTYTVSAATTYYIAMTFTNGDEGRYLATLTPAWEANDPGFYFDPADGSWVETLSEFTIGYTGGGLEPNWGNVDYKDMLVVDATTGETVTYIKQLKTAENGAPTDCLVAVLNAAIDTEGTYTVIFPARTFADYTQWSDDGVYIFPDEVHVTYHVGEATADDLLYVEICNEIKALTNALADAWDEVLSEHGAAVETLTEDYEDIVDALETLQYSVDELYADGDLTSYEDDIYQQLADIEAAIDALLAKAEELVPTGINSVNTDYSGASVYTLTGQKVNAPTAKGIYIINGKKVYIK